MPIVESLNSKAAVKQYTNQDIPSTGFTGNGANWVAKEISLTVGQASISPVFSVPQPDISYVVFVMMVNVLDANPQIQQVEVTSKSTTGFTAQWNMPVDSGNYSISYILPPKEFVTSEAFMANASTSFVDPFFIIKSSAIYPVLAITQNLTDQNPKFQTLLVSNKASTDITVTCSDPTDSSNYAVVAMFNATAQQNINSGVSSIVVNLPVPYGASANYAIIATMTNLVDTFPKFQPMIVTAKNSSNFTLSWPENTETANYQLSCYAVSLTT